MSSTATISTSAAVITPPGAGQAQPGSGDSTGPDSFTAMFEDAVVRTGAPSPQIAAPESVAAGILVQPAESDGEAPARPAESGVESGVASAQVAAAMFMMAAPTVPAPTAIPDAVSVVAQETSRNQVDSLQASPIPAAAQTRSAMNIPPGADATTTAPAAGVKSEVALAVTCPVETTHALPVKSELADTPSVQIAPDKIEIVQSVDAEVFHASRGTRELNAQAAPALPGKARATKPAATTHATAAPGTADPEAQRVTAARFSQPSVDPMSPVSQPNVDPMSPDALPAEAGTTPAVLSVSRSAPGHEGATRPASTAALPETKPEILFDNRHTESDVVPAATLDTQAAPKNPAKSTSQAALPIVSSAASNSAIAAVSQDNQQTTDRNVAMERSTKMSLGSALAGASDASTADEAAPHRESAEHGGEQSSPERNAPPTSSLENRFSAAGVSPAGSPLAAGPIASTTATAVSKSQDRVRIVEQVTQKLDTLRLANGRQEVTIHLRPDHLGDLRLTIVADRNDVVTQVVAETAAARDAVHEGREQLRASLEQKGYTLQGLDVSLGSGSQHNSAPYDRSDPSSRGYARSARTTTPDTVAVVLPAVSRVGNRTSAGRLDYEA